jgi:hypothetical protein
VTNALVYYGTELFTVVKSITMKFPRIKLRENYLLRILGWDLYYKTL